MKTPVVKISVTGADAAARALLCPVSLGQRYRDTISGFSGVATARTIYLHSTPRVQIAPESLSSDGKPAEPQWFEESQIGEAVEPSIGLRSEAPECRHEFAEEAGKPDSAACMRCGAKPPPRKTLRIRDIPPIMR